MCPSALLQAESDPVVVCLATAQLCGAKLPTRPPESVQSCAGGSQRSANLSAFVWLGRHDTQRRDGHGHVRVSIMNSPAVWEVRG